MQKGTYAWLAAGIALIGVLFFIKWEIARNRRQLVQEVGQVVAEAPGKIAKETARQLDQIAASNAPAASNDSGGQTSTQNFFGAALDVVTKTGRRAGEILSSNTTSAGGAPDKTADTVGRLLDLASDTERQLDQLGLDRTQLTDEEEMEVGRKMDQEILREMPEASDPQTLARLRTVAGPLFEQRKRKAIDYQIRIVRS